MLFAVTAAALLASASSCGMVVHQVISERALNYFYMPGPQAHSPRDYLKLLRAQPGARLAGAPYPDYLYGACVPPARSASAAPTDSADCSFAPSLLYRRGVGRHTSCLTSSSILLPFSPSSLLQFSRSLRAEP